MKAREWIEHCSGSEWGNEVMWRIAQERFAADPTLDIVQVYEHAGWHLSYNRNGDIVGTANDMATFKPQVREWAQQFDGVQLVGWCRRSDTEPHSEYKSPSYYPKIAA